MHYPPLIEDIYEAIGAPAALGATPPRSGLGAGGIDGYHRVVDLPGEAASLRGEAEARPLKLPVNRRVDERHHAVSPDGLNIWFTLQVSPHSRIWEALFEREDRMPSDEECQAWLAELLPGEQAAEAYALPGSHARRFEVFERNPELEAPIS
jgi:hypothetical protein